MGIRRTIPDDCGGKYYFDAKRAGRAVRFFPKHLRLFEGEWAGQPLHLMPWCETIIRDVFGWRRQDGTRRYRLVYVWIPRKNAKSTMAAGVGLLCLVADGEAGAQVYTIAATESQARIVFDFAGNMVGQSPQLAPLITPFKDSLWVDNIGAVMRPLTGKARGKHGLNAHCIIGDEIHEWPSDDLYTFVHQSEGTRRQPLDFLISTAGLRDGVGWEHFQFCEAILNGEILAEDVYVFIAAADPKKDADNPLYWASEEAVREANPSLGHTVKLEFLMGEIEKARTNPRKVNDIKRYYLNLWVDQASVWLDMAAWDACGHADSPYENEKPSAAELAWSLEPKTLPTIYINSNKRWKRLIELCRGRRCLVGIDLSSTTDLTATVYVFPPDDKINRWIVIPRFFMPRGEREEDLKAKIKRDKFDYEAAAQVGAIVLTDGPVLDYDIVFNDFKVHAEMFEVAAVGIDRWNATSTATAIANEGFEVAMFGQGFGSMSGPSKFLERKLLQKGLDHGGQPVLRWNARNVAVKTDGAENLKPVKDESTGRIDGIVAAIIAIGISDEYTDEGPSVYEKRGVIVLG